MAQRFVMCDREQSFLMPPDVREWLPMNHLAWFVIDAVEDMDLDPFYAAYRLDGRSRPPYDPAMMVALLLYAYARGVPSSRRIERACVEDVAFRVISAQQRPDHATIARFVQSHQDAVAGLFGEVLALCARAGLAQVGVIAVDGTKVAANASRDANLAYEQIARELVEQAIETDRAEDERFGEARGDELPPEFSTSAGRRGWLREAKKRLEAERSANPQPVPRRKPRVCRTFVERRRPESNRCTRLCRPLRSHSATAPGAAHILGRRAVVPAQRRDPLAVGVGELEVEDVEVLDAALVARRLGHGRHLRLLDQPAQRDLAAGLAVLRADLGEVAVARDPPAGQGRVGGQHHVALVGQAQQRVLAEERVVLDLVGEQRQDPERALKHAGGEVRHAG